MNAELKAKQIKAPVENGARKRRFHALRVMFLKIHTIQCPPFLANRSNTPVNVVPVP